MRFRLTAGIGLIVAAIVGGLAAWSLLPPSGSTSVDNRTVSSHRPLTGTATTRGIRDEQVSLPDVPWITFRAQELPFTYERGESGAAWPVEPTGGGVGILDYDRDGRLDLFFAQGVPLPPGSGAARPSDVLLRNVGERRFEDVSGQVGLTYKGYGMGVAVADYDGDGDGDVYVTRYGTNTLWRNDAGFFRDVTDDAGVGCPLWSLGAAFADFDGDGDLDLFVANYFDFDPAKAPFDRDPQTGAPNYGLPQSFRGQPDVLYRNEGGRFRDVTTQSGIADQGRGMGVLAADFDQDGRIDVLVANDAEQNALWHNQGGGWFVEVGSVWGIAVNADGQAEANMGIAYGDIDGDAASDVLISHFYSEHDTLWCGARLADGTRFFFDTTRQAGMSVDSRPLTGWGTVFADFDHDGRLDAVVVNGHIRREPRQFFIYDNPPILWQNLGDRRFRNVTATAGSYFQSLHQARGLAAGDLDNDGDLDLVVVHHHQPAVVLWNESPPQGNWLKVKLVGASPNSDAIGAHVTAQSGSRTWVREIVGGGSYLSSHDTTAHFGCGDATSIDKLIVRWPSGKSETRRNVRVNTTITIRESNTKTP
jgi:hypothetical protein